MNQNAPDDLKSTVPSDVLEIWKQTIEVQKHFNDLCLRIRNLAVTAMAAVLAAVGYTYESGRFVPLFGLEVPVPSAILFVATMGLALFYLLDRKWYHVLLGGAVEYASALEKDYFTGNLKPGLSVQITNASRDSVILGKRFSIKARHKLDFVYLLAALIMLIAAIGLWESADEPDGEGRVDTTSSAQDEA